MTEPQMMGLICPILDTRPQGFRTIAQGVVAEAQKCIGARCAMWRWEKQPEHSKKIQDPEPAGYCGMAGKP